jgi:hypothetical protein
MFDYPVQEPFQLFEAETSITSLSGRGSNYRAHTFSPSDRQNTLALRGLHCCAWLTLTQLMYYGLKCSRNLHKLVTTYSLLAI